MLATFTMVGRQVGTPSIHRINGKNFCSITLETERPFRTEAGNLETDRFVIDVWRGIAEECAASWHDGSVLVVRGRIETRPEEGKPRVRLIGEKVSLVREAQ